MLLQQARVNAVHAVLAAARDEQIDIAAIGDTVARPPAVAQIVQADAAIKGHNGLIGMAQAGLNFPRPAHGVMRSG